MSNTSTTTSQAFVNRVISLRVEGLNYKEIAKILETTRNLVNKAVTARNKGYETIREYDEMKANKYGYNSFRHYVSIKRILRLEEQPPLQTIPPREIADIIDQNNQYNPKTEAVQEIDNDRIHRMINKLPKKQRGIIIDLYFNGKTVSELAKRDNVDRRIISGFQIRAIETMREILGIKVLNKEPIRISDGELLLRYILSKMSREYGKMQYALNTINDLFYDGKRVVSNKEAIYGISFKKSQMKRLDALRAKYFPKN